jgi:hypothetical protein
MTHPHPFPSSGARDLPMYSSPSDGLEGLASSPITNRGRSMSYRLGAAQPPRRAAGPRRQPEPFEGNALTAARRPS